MQLLKHRFYSSPALADAALGVLTSYCHHYHHQYVTKQQQHGQGSGTPLSRSGGKQKQQQGKGSSKKKGRKVLGSTSSNTPSSSSSSSSAAIAAASSLTDLPLPADHARVAVAGGVTTISFHLRRLEPNASRFRHLPDTTTVTSAPSAQQPLLAVSYAKELFHYDAHYNAHMRCLKNHLMRHVAASPYGEAWDPQALSPGHPQLSTLLPASAASLSLILEGIALTAVAKGCDAIDEGLEALRWALYAANDATRREFLAARGALLLQVLWMVCKGCVEKYKAGDGKMEGKRLLEILAGWAEVYNRLTCGQNGLRDLGERGTGVSVVRYFQTHWFLDRGIGGVRS